MLIELLKANNYRPCFTMVEVGALPWDQQPEPFYALLSAFPGSRNVGFEVDEALCERLNRNAVPGMEFYAHALGRADETRTFYNTVGSMCGSLYEPDERWPDLFWNLDVTRKTGLGKLEVTTFARFAKSKGIETVDFMKLDIQGAELAVLEGAGKILDDVLCIVCEVEFVDMYKEQPLFGDVDAFLRLHGFMFHKFLGVSGRAMAPLVYNNDMNCPSQLMWSDAVFVRDLRTPERLLDEQLLKLAIYMEMYGSPDVCHYLVAQFDRRRGTKLAETLLQQLIAP